MNVITSSKEGTPKTSCLLPARSCLMNVILKDWWDDDGVFCNPCHSNPTLFSLLERQGVNISHYFGSMGRPKMRFREESFSVNDLVAVLDTTQQSQINGVPVLVLNPATSDCFDEAYFKKNGWEEKHRKCWAQLTSTPSFFPRTIGSTSKASMWTLCHYHISVREGWGHL